MTNPLVNEVIGALSKFKNVLLYGPPGTGKTWLLSEVVNFLQSPQPAGGQPTLRLGAANGQFGTSCGTDDSQNLPENLEVEWVTFHQGYSYEEFIIGKRPKPSEGGLILEPNFGVLMSIAFNITLDGGSRGCLLIIDEINRANASQVFGEFITLLDPDYRATIRGAHNPNALKIRLPGIAYEDGKSEEITMLRGGKKVRLPEDWTFPEHVYVLATMNSVDKAALPLDSALTRRFYRIEMGSNLALLAQDIGIDMDALAKKAKSIREQSTSIDTLSAEETTILLLDRINILIASDMGEDFELGHALLRSVVTADTAKRWAALINVWDHTLLPQLRERYAGRFDSLRDLLKVAPGSLTQSAFYERNQIGSAPTLDAPLALNRLSHLTEPVAITVLRQLSI